MRVPKENVIQESYDLQGRIVGRSPGRFTPILPGRTQSTQIPLADMFLQHKYNFTRQTPKIIWELYADNAPCQKGEMPFFEIKQIKN